MNSIDSTDDSESGRWKISLSIFALGTLAVTAFFDDTPDFGIGQLAGGAFVASMLAYLPFHLLFMRSQSQRRQLISFMTLYAAALVGGIIASHLYRRDAIALLSTIETEYHDSLSARSDSTPNTNSQAQAHKASGALGEVATSMREFIARMATQRREYESELNEIGWGTFLNAQRLASDPELRNSKVMVQRAREIVDRFEARTATLLADTKNGISALNVTPDERIQLLESFDRGMSRSESQIRAQWQLERSIVEECDGIVSVLSSGSTWSVKNNQLLFYSEPDLAKYNAHLLEIQRLTTEQSDLQKQAIDLVESRMRAARETISE